MQSLTQSKANIDMECQTLTFFYNDLAGTSLSNKSDTLVWTTKAIILPRSKCLIPVMVTPEFGTGLAISEPSIKLHKLRVALEVSVI